MNMMDGAFTQQNRKETTAPFGVNSMRSQCYTMQLSLRSIWVPQAYLTNL